MSRFVVNQKVRIKREYPGPNRRVPQYARGKTGVIAEVHGVLYNVAHDHADDWGPLYSVVLEHESSDGHRESKIIVDINEPWLEESL